MSNIYTKGGDKGQTSLIGGSRVSKGDLRVECYGTIDELNSALGLAYALSDHAFTKMMIRHVQEKLFIYSAELAADEKGLKRLEGKLLTDADIKRMEEIIDQCTVVNGMQRCFVIPGETPCSAALHLARTIGRRAERYIVRLSEKTELRPEAIRYINRASDTIYALGRLEETYHQIDALQAAVIDAVLAALWSENS